jgi:hypothetical protein
MTYARIARKPRVSSIKTLTSRICGFMGGTLRTRISRSGRFALGSDATAEARRTELLFARGGISVRVDDRAHVLALQGLGDVSRSKPVDDLDLFLVFGVCHELE